MQTTVQMDPLPVQIFRTEQTLQTVAPVTQQTALIFQTEQITQTVTTNLIMMIVQTPHPITEIITQMIIPIMEMILISPTTVKNSPVKSL